MHAELLIDETPLEDVVEPTSVRDLFLVPATIELAGAEIELVSAMSREMRLRSALADVGSDYDYILISMPGRGNFAFGERDDKAIPYRGKKINTAVNQGSMSYFTLAHELAHCMGLPDLFRSLGFKVAARPSKARTIMRFTIK